MDHLYGFMDPDTVELIIQLQRQDLEDAMSSTKTEHKTDDLSDADLAMQLQFHELGLIETFRADRNMARSHAYAILADKSALVAEVAAEQQACRDRELARQLDAAPDDTNFHAPDMPAPNTDVDDEAMERQEARISATISSDQVVCERPKLSEEDCNMATRGAKSKQKILDCVACGEAKPWFDVLSAPCSHGYCTECLSTLFETSMIDESLYPPRCCRQNIPLDAAKAVLNPKLFRNFQKKSVELDTKNRTYCFDPLCSRFISSENIQDDIARCGGCGKRTCATCKAAAHAGDCPRNEALQQLLQVADNQGWQRCSRCRRVVDLAHGCNHITCPCGHHFCYVCGADWKPRSCTCPQWDEARLEQRAAEIVRRDPRHRLYQPPQGALDPGVPAHAAEPLVPQDIPPIPIPIPRAALPVPIPPAALPVPVPPAAAPVPVPQAAAPVPVPQAAAPVPVPQAAAPVPVQQPVDRFQDLVRQVMNQLEDDHECDHNKWKWVKGRHRCEECDFVLPEYIFECRQCRLRACNRCRRNRL